MMRIKFYFLFPWGDISNDNVSPIIWVLNFVYQKRDHISKCVYLQLGLYIFDKGRTKFIDLPL